MYFNAGFYNCLHVSSCDYLVLERRGYIVSDSGCDIISFKDRYISLAADLQIVHLNERLT